MINYFLMCKIVSKTKWPDFLLTKILYIGRTLQKNDISSQNRMRLPIQLKVCQNKSLNTEPKTFSDRLRPMTCFERKLKISNKIETEK